MEHVTACYWQKETVRRLYFCHCNNENTVRRGASVVYACISDNRELLMNLQNKIEEELAGEGYLETVHGKKGSERNGRNSLRQWTKTAIMREYCAWTAECFCLSHGRMRISADFSGGSGEPDGRVWKDQCMVGEVEAGTAILLTDQWIPELL